MKSILVLIAVTSLIFASCNDTANSGKQVKTQKYRMGTLTSASKYQFIPKDSANKMLSSYLNSINYTKNDTDLRSLILNADSLRAYLKDTTIASVKIMFAHTLDYINNGNKDQYAGYQSGALTLIIAGYDTSGNYVFYPPASSTSMFVLNHAVPCPTSCPTKGTAASDHL